MINTSFAQNKAQMADFPNHYNPLAPKNISVQGTPQKKNRTSTFLFLYQQRGKAAVSFTIHVKSHPDECSFHPPEKYFWPMAENTLALNVRRERSRLRGSHRRELQTKIPTHVGPEL